MLNSIACTDNLLKSLDVSKNQMLSILDCSYNQITGINIGKNLMLMSLACINSKLKSLDVSGCTLLSYLFVSSNEMTTLDLTANLKLAGLSCDANKLKKLELSPSVKFLSCSKNQLQNLSLYQCTELSQLRCQDNQIKKLNVSNCQEIIDKIKKNEAVDMGSYWAYCPSPSEDGFYDICFDKTVEVNLGDSVIEPVSDQPEIGSIFTKDGLKYKVTSKNTVALIGLEKPMSLKTVDIPNTVSFSREAFKVTEIAAKAMYKDTKVRTVTMGKNVKTIGKNAFAACTKLATVSGGEGVATIEDSAFSGCKMLKTFPVMSKLQTIGASTFKGCVKLAKFTLAAKVKSIGKNAFNGCNGLKNIVVKTTKLTEKNVGNAAFKGIYKKATFKCPKNKLKAYRKLFIKKGAPKNLHVRMIVSEIG